MIKEIQILSNATARLTDETGLTKNVDLLKPLIDELINKGEVDESTVINSTLNFGVKVSDWYQIPDKIGKS